MPEARTAHPRRNIYYWKCDRPAAFHGTQARDAVDEVIERQLGQALRQHFSTSNVVLRSSPSQGHHLTWNADIDGTAMFVRVENGPEEEDRMELESAMADTIRAAGVPAPRVHGFDASRSHVPFAWQAQERIAHPDLNHWHKQGMLDVPRIASEIGAAVARWQSIRPAGFGPFNSTLGRGPGRLCGYHAGYADYFQLRLEEHLAYLLKHGFLDAAQCSDLAAECGNHRSLLQLEHGCFVHKDLALWNILGTRHHAAAFIDFDDAISGDPMDDLSLLACFHDAGFLGHAFSGYASIRPLPENHLRRFWLHLLRNMIVKAVIRVGAGYFDRDDGFFLIPRGSSGGGLREFTLSRLNLALTALRNGHDIDIL